MTQTATSKQAYLDYFNAIKGKGCISGQFIRWNYNASLEEIGTIHDISDQWVGMLGADYFGNFQDSVPAPDCDYHLANKVIKSYYPKNGLVNLSVHFNNPQTGGSAWEEEMDFDSVLIEGSRVYLNFISQLDCVAEGLRDLQDAGVMVMFRPFHEMTGGWFWWGQRERYTELWIMTYEYVVEQKGIGNLLWCWSTGAQAEGFDPYYPGDAYVDVVGFDAYTSDLTGCCLGAYRKMLKYGKPFGISEYGCVSGGAREAEPFDYAVFLSWLKASFPETTYFLTWRDHWGMVGQKGVRELLNDQYIINREDLIELRQGQ